MLILAIDLNLHLLNVFVEDVIWVNIILEVGQGSKILVLVFLVQVIPDLIAKLLTHVILSNGMLGLTAYVMQMLDYTLIHYAFLIVDNLFVPLL